MQVEVVALVKYRARLEERKKEEKGTFQLKYILNLGKLFYIPGHHLFADGWLRVFRTK